MGKKSTKLGVASLIVAGAEMKQMEKLCFYLQATPVKSKSKVQDLLKGIEPVEYYYKDRNEIVRCSRLDVLPRIAGVWNE